VAEKARECRPADRRPFARSRKQCLQFGAEHEQAADFAPVQRLDAETVADEGEGPGQPVPDGEGEHADEGLDGLADAPAAERLDHGLGVGVATEHVAQRREARAQIAVTVDLAVVREHIAPASRNHRLPPRRRQVDHG